MVLHDERTYKGRISFYSRLYTSLHKRTLDLNSSSYIGQIKLIFILIYFAQPNKNNNFPRPY